MFNPNPLLILVNQFGEQSQNFVDLDQSTYLRNTTSYSEDSSFQVVAPDLSLAVTAGSNDPADPSFLAAVMGNVIGASLTHNSNYLAGLIGAYSITGAKATTLPTAGVLGIVSDGVTDVDGAVVAHVDGDEAVTVGNAAFKAMMANSHVGSGFNYGLDLHHPAGGGYLALAIKKADLRMSNEICVLNSATTPVSGGSGTGAAVAAKGSLCVARDTGVAYVNVNTKASPTWTPMFNGTTNKAAHQADSAAADIAAMVVDFNALLAKIQAAGLMA